MKNFLLLLTGVAVGSVVTHVYHTRKYEARINEEFREAREYKKKHKNNESSIKDAIEDIDDRLCKEREEFEEAEEQFANGALSTVRNIINYSKYSSREPESEICKKREKPNAFVITPEEFGNVSGYDCDTLYYYDNNVITNEKQERIDDVVDLLGSEVAYIKSQFGIHEENAVYVRNNNLKTDFEILLEINIFEEE